MTFNLIEKLKEEMRLMQTDLVSYNNEQARLQKTKDESHAEYQRALAVFDNQINDVKGSIAMCESAIAQYEFTLNFLTNMEGRQNVNG